MQYSVVLIETEAVFHREVFVSPGTKSGEYLTALSITVVVASEFRME